jgi:hypothetical protein
MGVGTPTPLHPWEISDNAIASPPWESSTQIEFKHEVIANLLIAHIL